MRTQKWQQGERRKRRIGVVTWTEQEGEEKSAGGVDDVAQVSPEEEQGDSEREQELQHHPIGWSIDGENPQIAGGEAHQDAHYGPTHPLPNLRLLWPYSDNNNII